MSTYPHVYISRYLHFHMSSCLHICISTYPHVYISPYLHVCISTCLHANIPACQHICIYVQWSVYGAPLIDKLDRTLDEQFLGPSMGPAPEPLRFPAALNNTSSSSSSNSSSMNRPGLEQGQRPSSPVSPASPDSTLTLSSHGSPSASPQMLAGEMSPISPPLRTDRRSMAMPIMQVRPRAPCHPCRGREAYRDTCSAGAYGRR